MVAVAVVATLAALFPPDASAQWAHDRGQSVVPAFEGWEANPDGTFSMVFGFFNRNCHEILHLPVGPDNNVEPGGPDRGQPTRFYPRRAEFVFKVPVPADFGDRELVWTLTVHGRTEQAYASLQPEYVLDRQITMMNEASYGQRVGESDNQYPVVELDGPAERTVAVGEPLELTARVSDDGLPEPRPDRSHLAKLMAGWLVYRGNDEHVTFEPPQFNPDQRRRAGASPLCQGSRTRAGVGRFPAEPGWGTEYDGDLQRAGNLRAAGAGPRHRAEDGSRSHGHRHGPLAAALRSKCSGDATTPELQLS